jgi:hypothetical protein
MSARRPWVLLSFLVAGCPSKEAPKPAPDDPERIDCDKDTANGREVDPRTDPKNCGACGRICENPHGTTACVDGKCQPKCDVGWAACSLEFRGCIAKPASDPLECGNCTTVCRGAPCNDGKCAAVEVVAQDVPGAVAIRLTDGKHLYLAPFNGPTYRRILLADGKVQEVDVAAHSLPIAFDGKSLYGCRFAKAEDSPCELTRREGDGPEKKVATLPRLLWASVATVSGDVVYWARVKDVPSGTDRDSDIVATPLAGGETVVVVPDVKDPRGLVVHGASIVWAAQPDHHVRMRAIAGGPVMDLGEVKVPSALADAGTQLFVAGMDGVSRVLPSGGAGPNAAEAVVRGLPPGLKPMFDTHTANGVAVIGDKLYWGVNAKDVSYLTVVRAPLPAAP